MRTQISEGFLTRIRTDKPIAYDSPDHLIPYGTAENNSTNPKFNRKLSWLHPIKNLRLLDIGCAGGGFVKSIIDEGGFAVGIEGSDYSLKRQRAEWPHIPNNLFTADATAPFHLTRVTLDTPEDKKGHPEPAEQPLLFDVITGWEFLEHIKSEDLPAVFDNVNRHLERRGLAIFSVATFSSPVDGVELHQTIQPRSWWLEAVHRLGFVHHEAIIHIFGRDWVRTQPGSFYLVLTRKGEVPFFQKRLWQLRLRGGLYNFPGNLKTGIKNTLSRVRPALGRVKRSFFAKCPPPVARPIVGAYRVVRFTTMYPQIPDIAVLWAIFSLGLWPNNVSFNRVTRTVNLLGPMQSPLSLTVMPTGEWVVAVADLRFFVESYQDIMILQDVLIAHPYNDLVNRRYAKPAVMWDIGMNIGSVSLLLARHPDVVHVYGYEPFTHTYDCAVRSLELNPALKPKISAFNAGIAGRSEELIAEYSARSKASMGLKQIPAAVRAEQGISRGSIKHETIRLLSASDVLSTIRQEHPLADIIAKIDCEGAEYDIIESLEATGQLDELVALVVELHKGAGEEMQRRLERAGFIVEREILPTSAGIPLEMLRASRPDADMAA